MRLFYFNLNKPIPEHRDVHTLIPAIIFSDEAVVYSGQSAAIGPLIEQNFWDDKPKIIHDFYKSFYSLSRGEEQVNQTVAMLKEGLRLEHKKMRTVADNKYLIAAKKMHNRIKQDVYDYIKWSLELNYLEKLNAYEKAGNLYYTYVVGSEGVQGDKDELNAEIFNSVFLHPAFYIIFTEDILLQASIADINSDENAGNFNGDAILTAGVINLPGCAMLKQSKLSLLSDDLNPHLSNWQQCTDKLMDDFKGLSFTADSLGAIREKINTVYQPCSDELEKKVNDSIYINQLANGEWGEYGGTLSLAVSSRKTLMNILKNTRQMSEDTFEVLYKNFEAANDLDKIVLFFIHSMPQYPAPATIRNEDIRPTWEASFS